MKNNTMPVVADPSGDACPSNTYPEGREDGWVVAGARFGAWCLYDTCDHPWRDCVAAVAP